MRNPIHSWFIQSMSSWRNLGTDLFLGTLSLHMSKQFDPARPHLLRRPNLEMKRFKACMKMTRAKQVMSTSRRVKNDSFDYYVPAHVDFYGIEDFSLPSCTCSPTYLRNYAVCPSSAMYPHLFSPRDPHMHHLKHCGLWVIFGKCRTRTFSI